MLRDPQFLPRFIRSYRLILDFLGLRLLDLENGTVALKVVVFSSLFAGGGQRGRRMARAGVEL